MSLVDSTGAWWCTVRTSSARILGPIGFLVAVVMSFQAGWIGTGWNDTVRAAINHSGFLAFLVAAAAALDARRYRFTDPTADSSSRGLSPVLVPMVAVATWGIAGMLLLVVASCVAAAAVSSWHAPSGWLVAVGAAWFLELAGVGWLLGWWLPVFASVPLAMLLSWLVNAALGAETDTWSAVFSGFDSGGFTSSIAPNTPVLAAQFVFFATLGLLACGSVRVARLHLVSKVAGAVAIIAAVAVVTVLLHRAGPLRAVEVRSATGPRICAEQSATAAAVCVWPDNSAAAVVAAEQAAGMWKKLNAGGAATPAGVIDQGLSAPSSWVSVPLWSADPRNVATGLSEATMVWLWCGPESDHVDDTYEELFTRELWLQSQVQPVVLGYSSELADVLHRSDAEQVRWLLHRPHQARCVNR